MMEEETTGAADTLRSWDACAFGGSSGVPKGKGSDRVPAASSLARRELGVLGTLRECPEGEGGVLTAV